MKTYILQNQLGIGVATSEEDYQNMLKFMEEVYLRVGLVNVEQIAELRKKELPGQRLAITM